ncbi:AI-2E family transporter [Vannielia litorea]|uniref:AI-2E family transporter n=1 Tax=Vannielia TaxID=2813041 RepID=UPI001C98E3EA|nr:AI-2E family transporter [Vannielia litorea]MBY6048092.1 AI-2E family transporter [Vannielia litorea]MBY6075506.1 AI-2E family transporter [Vannielia litorea]MBY6152007.1 AI-2E family transporter [Vannielia litorea]
MALPVRDQAKYWGLAAVVFFGVLYLLGDVILPFVLGGAVAYCLDPVADRLERMGLHRIAAVIVISLVALLIFILGALLIVPTLVEQSVALFKAAPQIFSDLRNFLTARFPDLMDGESTVSKSLSTLGETIQSRGGELVSSLVSSVSGLVNVLVLLVLVPIVAFYLLLDWDRMVAKVDDLLPRDHAPTIRHLAHEIDKTLAAFIRGQGTVCLVLGIFYAVALMAVGLNFGLVVGAVAGALTFIPYVGALVGGALAIGLAFFQFWGEWWWIGAVAVIFFVGQFLEGNVLTPNLVGQSVGLHPVWLIFALSAFGALFGFTGMLVAVPVAASLGVIARWATRQYKEGRLYRGTEEAPPATAAVSHADEPPQE